MTRTINGYIFFFFLLIALQKKIFIENLSFQNSTGKH